MISALLPRRKSNPTADLAEAERALAAGDGRGAARLFRRHAGTVRAEARLALAHGRAEQLSGRDRAAERLFSAACRQARRMEEPEVEADALLALAGLQLMARRCFAAARTAKQAREIYSTLRQYARYEAATRIEVIAARG